MNESIPGERTASEPQERSSGVAHSIEVPSEIIRKWQEIVNLLAEIRHVPSASIMRVDPPHIKVFVSSTSEGNPCEPGALDTGPYCETVMKTGQPLLIPDALENEAWKANPHVRLGMISYLGVPIGWPDGRIFGTICVRDAKRNENSEAYLKLLLHFRDMLQADLKSLARLHGEIEERETKIRRLVDSNIMGVFIWDFDGRILEANDEFLRMVNYDREDLIAGRITWTTLTPPDWRDRNNERIEQQKSSGRFEPFEKEYTRKGGGRVPVLIGGATFEQGGNQGVAFVLDLTDRKQAELGLRDSEERFRTLIQFSFDVYWESDAQHRFTRQEFPEGLADAPALGFEIGLTRWEVPYLEPDAETWRKHRETLDAHLPFRDFELARPTPDGGKRYVSVSGLPVFDESGRFIGYRGVGRHITERKRAEEALRRSEAYLAEAQRLSHTGTSVFNASGNLYWSEECYRIWELDPTQGPPDGEAVMERIHPDDRDRM